VRKTTFVQISQEEGNRDSGKIFFIKEMPALQAEKWALRLILALSRANVDIPDDVANAGMAGVATLGLKMLGQMSFPDAESLLDEMMSCVRHIPDPSRVEVTVPLIMQGGDGDTIEEITTLTKLRLEVLQLHAGFFTSALQSNFGKPSSTPPVV